MFAAKSSRRLAWGTRALHLHLRDPSTVHRVHLETVALDLDGVPHRRETSEPSEDHAPDRVVRLVLEAHLQLLAQRVERRQPVDNVRAWRLFAERRDFSVELILHLADELLEDVLERHQSGGPAELVED